jgi:hypothetical protein
MKQWKRWQGVTLALLLFWWQQEDKSFGYLKICWMKMF